MKKILLYSLLFGTCFSNNILATNKNADKKNNKENKRQTFVAPENLTENDYVANTIIFKVKPEFRNNCNRFAITDADILNAMNGLVISNVKKMFPFSEQPKCLHCILIHKLM